MISEWHEARSTCFVLFYTSTNTVPAPIDCVPRVCLVLCNLLLDLVFLCDVLLPVQITFQFRIELFWRSCVAHCGVGILSVVAADPSVHLTLPQSDTY